MLYIRAFLYKQHFYKQHQAEIGKNQANTKQHQPSEFTTAFGKCHRSAVDVFSYDGKIICRRDNFYITCK